METEKTNTITLHLLERAWSYNRWIYDQIRPYLNGEILEVGCGIGNLTGFLLHQGGVMATDIEEKYLDILGKKYDDHPNFRGALIWDVRQRPPEKFLFRFGTVVCSNVLEHIENDDQALRYFHQLLGFGGKLILLVPALKVLYNHLDKGLGHFRRYGREELSQKLIGSGFTISYLRYFNLFGMFGWFVNGTLLRRALLPKGQVGLFNRLVPLFITMEKILPKWFGQSLIAVGEKR